MNPNFAAFFDVSDISLCSIRTYAPVVRPRCQIASASNIRHLEQKVGSRLCVLKRQLHRQSFFRSPKVLNIKYSLIHQARLQRHVLLQHSLVPFVFVIVQWNLELAVVSTIVSPGVEKRIEAAEALVTLYFYRKWR
jgi:hypothetical protein